MMLDREIRKNIILKVLGVETQHLPETEEMGLFEIHVSCILECMLQAKNIDRLKIADPDSKIALIWGIEDVQSDNVRPDLSDEQALKVLQIMQGFHSITGVSWDSLKACAHELYPKEES